MLGDMTEDEGWVSSELAANRLELLGRIAGGVAHDVASYLSIVDASLVIAGRVATEALVHGELARARSALDRAARLTRTMLRYARGDAPQREPVDLAAVVKRTLELLERMIPTEIAVPVDFDLTAPLIAAVPIEIEQLVLNLILNACEAMPDGGTLSVSVRTLALHVSLVTSDTGRGVPDDVLVANDSTPSTKRPGAGLGLQIVRAIARRCGASLRIEARHPRGTHIELLFPRLAR
jgi:signal transduction histidine kinase